LVVTQEVDSTPMLPPRRPPKSALVELRGASAITRVNPEGTFPLDPGSPDAIGGSDDAALQPGCIPSI